MPEYLFQIKGKLGEPESGWYGSNQNWSFPPIWQDKIEAKDRKEAKELIDEMYGKKFPLRVLAKDLESNEFLLTIKEIKESDYWIKKQFDITECNQCKTKFKVIEKYQLNSKSGHRDFCSEECKEINNQNNKPKNYLEFKESTAIHDYVIYKITNRSTEKCYIGQTKQAFTFRWYQHFYQPSEVKFHEAISSSPITDWVFEVIEVIDIPKDIKYDKIAIRKFVLNKETEYINKFNSIVNGYNSVKSLEEVFIDKLQQAINFKNDTDE